MLGHCDIQERTMVDNFGVAQLATRAFTGVQMRAVVATLTLPNVLTVFRKFYHGVQTS
jgi:hypothetical protein